jgi:hypothetical protein
MNLFRSEGRIARWLAGRNPGASITVVKLCELAHAWYGDRLDPDWRPHTTKMNQRIFDDLGLTGEFWQLVT